MGRADLNYWRLTHDDECLIAVNKNGPRISFAGFNSSSFEQSKKKTALNNDWLGYFRDCWTNPTLAFYIRAIPVSLYQIPVVFWW